MHPVRTHAAVLTLMLALAAACGETSDVNPPGPAPIAPATPVPAAAPTPSATAPTAPAEAPAGVSAQLVAAFDNTVGVPHRMRATMTNAAHGGPSSFVVEMQPPDRMRTTMTLPNGREMQIVAIGNDTWTNAMGRFIRMPGQPGAPGVQATATARIRAAISEGRVTYRLVGPETLDGRPMTVWEGTGPMDLGGGPSGPMAPPGPPPGPAAAPRMGTGRVWIGADNRVHRIQSRADEEGGTEIDIRVEYDPSIQIEPPPT